MEQRKINTEYELIATALLQTEKELSYIANSQVKIIYLESNSIRKHGKNLVYGICEKVPAKYRWKIPADFTITLFTPNITHMDQDQIRILIFHEMLHIGIQKQFSDETYYINKHDLEDFKTIVDKYGVDWDSRKK